MSETSLLAVLFLAAAVLYSSVGPVAVLHSEPPVELTECPRVLRVSHIRTLPMGVTGGKGICRCWQAIALEAHAAAPFTAIRATFPS